MIVGSGESRAAFLQRVQPRRLSALGALLLLAGGLARPAELQFEFTLDNEYSSSAGVFDVQGNLLRTLWSNRRLSPGRQHGLWDGRDDDGREARPDADYEVRVLLHNVTYRWDGVIGNSTPDPVSPFHHDGADFIKDLTIVGQRAFFTAPTEGPVPTMRYLDLGDSQRWKPRPGLPMSYGAGMRLVASDGERVYWSHPSSPWPHEWGRGGDQAFVIATDTDLRAEVAFTAGTPTCVQRTTTGCYTDVSFDARFRSAIDIVNEYPENPATPELEGARNDATGLAVARSGRLLFVAHGALGSGRLHLLDKRSGARLAVLDLAGAGRLAVGPEPDVLWAIHGGAGHAIVSRFRVGAAPGYTLTRELSLSGILDPLDLAVSVDGATLLVADGGESQQLKAFDARTGQPFWRLGEQGGYRRNGPLVRADKFSFRRYHTNAGRTVEDEGTFLSFTEDGGFWVGDPGLGRVLKFDRERHFLDQIVFQPVTYSLAVDRNDPTRVFSGMLEYLVDYRLPVEQAWRLQRYFGDSFGPDLGFLGFGAGFSDVVTLRNGRTYGLLRNGHGVELAEISAELGLRRLGPIGSGQLTLTADGSLRSVQESTDRRLVFDQRPLLAFDPDGRPSWGKPVRVASIRRDGRSPGAEACRHVLARCFAALDDGWLAYFDPGNDPPDTPEGHSRYHLAGLHAESSLARDRWTWRASPADAPFDIASASGSFDNTRPAYAGMAVSGAGADIVYGFPGEAWHGDAEANQFLHWNRDGLFVGQFGTPNERGVLPAAPGLAGNPLAIQVVAHDGESYLWHTDESAHAGVHRWHLDGTDWIREQIGTGHVGSSIVLDRRIERPERPANRPSPVDLTAMDVGCGGTSRCAGADVLLLWRGALAGATALEVERLTPTYTGRRFEPIAQLPPTAGSFIDRHPLYGVRATYRVRARYSAGASDYSNHVDVLPRASEVVLEREDFRTEPSELRDDFHIAGPPNGSVIAIVSASGGSAERSLRLAARRRVGDPELQMRPRWTAAPALFSSLVHSLARPLGGTPDVYRVDLRWRQQAVRLGAGDEVGLEIDVGTRALSTSSQRVRLSPRGPLGVPRTSTEANHFSYEFAAFPTGLQENPFGLFTAHRVTPGELSVAFPITLRSSGAEFDLLIDEFRVTGFRAPENVSLVRPDDTMLVAIPDPKVLAALHDACVLPASRPLTRRDLRSLYWLDLSGLGAVDLSGLEAALNLKAIDLRGDKVLSFSPLARTGAPIYVESTPVS